MTQSDGSKAPVEGRIAGQMVPETGKLLTLLDGGLLHEPTGIYGWDFEYGQTGLFSFDDGYYYISHNGFTGDRLQNSTVRLYHWIGKAHAPFELIE